MPRLSYTSSEDFESHHGKDGHCPLRTLVKVSYVLAIDCEEYKRQSGTGEMAGRLGAPAYCPCTAGNSDQL